MNLNKCVFIFLLSLFVTPTFSQHSIALHTGFSGEVIEGSKQLLIDEIRKGKSVRIGYQLDFNSDGVADFDHWATAEFITILDGEVFTQIRNINIQIPNMKVPQIDIMPNNIMWTAILGTNGLLKNRFVFSDLETEYDENGKQIIDEKMEKELKKREVSTWKVSTFWAIEK